MQVIVQQVQVGPDGSVVLPRLQIASGTTIDVIVLLPDPAQPDNALLHAATSSLDFWDNETDDRVWNHV